MVEAGAQHIPLAIESGQVIDTHHVALLVAAGPSAVFPYLALEQASDMKPGGASCLSRRGGEGLRKVIARMGISTISSYRNSHLFEVIGLDADVWSRFFEDASHSLAGRGLTELLQDFLDRHDSVFSITFPTMTMTTQLQDQGLYRFRHQGEQHAVSPELVRRMHRYIKFPTEENHRAFKELGQQREPVAVRDLMEIAPGKPLPLDEVETDAAILGRFSTQAMSLGAISPETHTTLAIAMNRLGGRSNTGEGGEDPGAPVPAARTTPGQTSGLGAFRSHCGISGARRRTGNQDRARCEARRRRPTAGEQSFCLHRAIAARRARDDVDFSAAAS